MNWVWLASPGVYRSGAGLLRSLQKSYTHFELDRKGGRFNGAITAGAITWATGLKRSWGRPPEPSWVVTLEAGAWTDRAGTLDALAALVAEAGLGGTEVRHFNHPAAKTLAPVCRCGCRSRRIGIRNSVAGDRGGFDAMPYSYGWCTAAERFVRLQIYALLTGGAAGVHADSHVSRPLRRGGCAADGVPPLAGEGTGRGVGDGQPGGGCGCARGCACSCAGGCAGGRAGGCAGGCACAYTRGCARGGAPGCAGGCHAGYASGCARPSGTGVSSRGVDGCPWASPVAAPAVPQPGTPPVEPPKRWAARRRAQYMECNNERERRYIDTEEAQKKPAKPRSDRATRTRRT